MALLGDIRNRFGWLMMGLILIGVGGFLFMDISPGNNAGGPRGVVVGSVNGEEIDQADIQRYVDELSGRGMIAEEMRDIAWNQLVREALLKQQTDKVGLAVTPTEMGELFLGDAQTMSPIVRSQFMNRQTMQINRDDIRQRIELFNNGDYSQFQPEQLEQVEEAEKAWKMLERRVKFDRLSSKYLSMVQQAVYTPSWMVNSAYTRQNTKFDFTYVRVPYTNIPNDKVNVTDEDLTNYIESMGKKYEKDASASIEYVTFEVEATPEDKAKYEADMEEIAKDFAKQSGSEEDSLFVFQNDGFIDNKYYTKDDLTDPQNIRDTLFSAENGSVFGPYVHENAYKVIKVLDSKIVPDSVKASHILREIKTQEDAQNAFALLDSLKKKIEAGEANFDSLAIQYSQDPGSAANGGDLGFAPQGTYVPPFERFVFHTGKKDSLGLVQTQFGLHLIKITDYKYINDKKGVKIAYITKDIVPSEQTVKTIHSKVNEFLTNSRTLEVFRENAQKEGLTISKASGLQVNGYEIVGLGKNSASADIIKWAHSEDTKPGQVASMPYIYDDEELNYTNKFVVPALVSKLPKGLATIDDPAIRAEVDRAVRNKKKAEFVKKSLGESPSLQAVADEYGVVIETASGFTYSSPMITNVGLEHAVAAVANQSEAGKTSKPIQGKQGVYVIRLNSKQAPPAPADVKLAQQQVSQRSAQVVSSQVFESLKENAEVEDNRSTFY